MSDGRSLRVTFRLRPDEARIIDAALELERRANGPVRHRQRFKRSAFVRDAAVAAARVAMGLNGGCLTTTGAGNADHPTGGK